MKLNPLLLTSGILAICLSGLFYFKHHMANAAGNQQMPEPVMSIKATSPQVQNYQQTTGLIGQARAVEQASIKNELAGKITRLNFQSGDLVTKGQVLLELSHSEEDAQLKAAKAEAALNRQTLDRYLALQENGRISDDKVDQAKSLLAKAEAEMERISAIIEKKVITAPFAGYTGIHDLAVGQYIDSNSQITNLIGDNDFIWIDFNVPQTYPVLALGESVGVVVKGKATQEAQASIVSVSPVLNSSSRQLKYRAKVAKSVLTLTPNQLVKINFPVAPVQALTLIPQLAVKRDQLGDYVFVLKKEGEAYRAHQVKVDLGVRFGDLISVESGLEPGVLIASEGAFKLWPGVQTRFASPDENQGETL
ncbi:efflux RND transporter periplasmic adaptor subunit [Thalassomonas viridans]|uniref:Efflux RND transporter periplasmic adaptor subunit n=1 Tax=Thalassomonas viridans TaxID=137584 RepID=A0AAE9Z908_9GAMM|nr:efflux RND transporter periplasmic adaptor subunit [Thalassomonas viridans]WDE08733.1 efflux RND transporter periplasmic adaptor subunit [Thalassomonas viridans]